MSKQDTYISYFTPSEMSAETLEFIFVKREKLAARLVERVRDSVLISAKYQSLLIGPRGIGKSHLVAMTYYRVKALPELDGKIAIAWLAEEEWGVGSLVDFYVVILEALDREYGTLRAQIDALYTLPDAERTTTASDLIRTFVGDRTLFLLVENLEEVFKSLSKDELWTFRSFLSKTPFATLLATTPSLFDALTKQKDAFFGFFQPTYLDELTVEEATELLGKIAARRGDTALTNFLKTPTAQDRVQAIHELAGGHPRLYLLFAHLLTQTNLDELVTPFLEFLDELTPYFQDRMKGLSPQQRKIVAFLCDQRGAAAVKEIVARTNGMSSQTVSGQLDKLETMGYVRKMRVGRESHYELREPLLRMIVEKKRGRNEPIRLVVDFLRRWYSREERHDRLARSGGKDASFWEASLDLNLAIQDTPDPSRAVGISFEFSQAKDNKDYARATELAAEVIERKGQSCKAEDWFWYAWCHREIGDYISALKYYDKAIEMDPKNSASWNNRGHILNSILRYEEGLESIDKAIIINSNDAIAWNNRGYSLNYLSRYEEALYSINKAITINPNDASNWNNAGLVLNNMARYEEALESLDKAIGINPGSLYALNNRGHALNNLARYEEALESIDKVIEIEPNNIAAWNNRGYALNCLARYEEALESIDKVIKIHPHDAVSWSNISNTFISLFRYEEALESTDKAIEIDPHDVVSWTNRAYILSSLYRDEEALESIDKAIYINPNDAIAWKEKGFILNNLYRVDEALRSIDESVLLSPENYRLWFHRGKIYLQNGYWDEFQKSIENGFILAKLHSISFYDAEEYCYILLQQSNMPEAKNVVDLSLIYSKYNALSILGQGLIASVPHLIAPEITQERAEAWRDAWNHAGADQPDLVVPLRLLNAAVAWKPKHDVRALLTLAIEERRVLERLLEEKTAEPASP